MTDANGVASLPAYGIGVLGLVVWRSRAEGTTLVKPIAISVLVLGVVALAQAAERARPSREELEWARRYREFAREVQFGRTPAGAAVTYTNVDGMVLGLVLSATNIVAGERLPAAMIVSNASPVSTALNLQFVPRRDTSVGDFVVTTEFGNVLPKVFRGPDSMVIELGGPDMGLLRPGEWKSFPGDVVLHYSLTNAGKYWIKAVAEVRSEHTWPESERITIAPPDLRPVLRRYTWPKSERMIIETAAVELTVRPRPEGSPMPELYPERVRSRLIRPGEEPPPHLVLTHPKPKRPPAKPPGPKLRPESR